MWAKFYFSIMARLETTVLKCSKYRLDSSQTSIISNGEMVHNIK